MDYPRFVFISPGANKCNGGTYDHEVVHNASEHKAAIEAGFSDSVPEALDAGNIAKSEIDVLEKPAAKRGRKPKDQE